MTVTALSGYSLSTSQDCHWDGRAKEWEDGRKAARLNWLRRACHRRRVVSPWRPSGMGNPTVAGRTTKITNRYQGPGLVGLMDYFPGRLTRSRGLSHIVRDCHRRGRSNDGGAQKKTHVERATGPRHP